MEPPTQGRKSGPELSVACSGVEALLMDSLNKWKLKHEQEPGEGGENGESPVRLTF